MSESLFASPDRPLNLSPHEKELIHETAQELLDEVQDEFENYLWTRKATTDATRWEILKEHENIRVHKEKRPGGGTAHRDMKLLLKVGTMTGTVDDILYGELNHTTDDMRKKMFYIDEMIIDGAVLATVVEPTREHPFQSLSVCWVVKSIPFVLRALAKHIDAVFLEATSLRELSNGERVGYFLMHSIAFPSTPMLPQYERVNISARTIYHQQSLGMVACFSMIYIEIKESFLTDMLLKSVADALLSAHKIVDCGQSKKLAR